ncbi:MAG TPA: hypothetical protein PLV13_12545, partial [Ilumatobacteraceae bacterium]|nr:hypothetical protein [Ilumatobacteraceae bacterium]
MQTYLGISAGHVHHDFTVVWLRETPLRSSPGRRTRTGAARLGDACAALVDAQAIAGALAETA